MFCSACGMDNDAVARFCQKCGGAITPDLTSRAGATPDLRMRHPDAQLRPAVSTALQVRSPATAAILSALIIGAGQLYNNDFKKAAVMFGAGILGVLFTAGIGTLGVWIWAMVDAHQVASGKGRAW